MSIAHLLKLVLGSDNTSTLADGLPYKAMLSSVNLVKSSVILILFSGPCLAQEDTCIIFSSYSL